jgi:hypothetical protein
LVAIHRDQGQGYQQVASHGYSLDQKADQPSIIQLTPTRGSIVGRTVLEGKTVHVSDVLADPAYTLGDWAKRTGLRSALGVPLVREGKPIAVMFLARRTVWPFTAKQIELATTFADQAVIAIENARLFEEVQARNGDLSVTLEQQTATSEVLSVISRSKFDLQPVLDSIARGAARLCGGVMGGVFRYDGKLMDVGSMVNFAPGGEETWRGLYPRPATTDTATGRAILNKSVVIVADVEADTRAEWARKVARTGGYRSAMAVPMLRGRCSDRNHNGRSGGARYLP